MLQLNRAKFSTNGSCGYVLKPQCMCQGEGPGHQGQGTGLQGRGPAGTCALAFVRASLLLRHLGVLLDAEKPGFLPCEPHLSHTLLASPAPAFSAGTGLTALSPGPLPLPLPPPISPQRRVALPMCPALPSLMRCKAVPPSWAGRHPVRGEGRGALQPVLGGLPCRSASCPAPPGIFNPNSEDPLPGQLKKQLVLRIISGQQLPKPRDSMLGDRGEVGGHGHAGRRRPGLAWRHPVLHADHRPLRGGGGHRAPGGLQQGTDPRGGRQR